MSPIKLSVSQPRIATPTWQLPPAVRCLIAVAVLACLPLPFANAQGKIVLKGTLMDSTGAPIPGMDVKLRSLAGAKELQASSDEDGYFEFEGLEPGKYVVDIAAPGFERVSEPVEIGTTAPRPLRIRLQLAQVKQQVTVRDKPYVTPSVEQNGDYIKFDPTALHELPILNGDPLAVPALFLEPASVGAQGPQLIVDGIETNSLDIPTSAVRSVAVNNNPYSAEFGRPGKGRIEVTTRQGSHRRYRGLVSLMVRNSEFDARNAFAANRAESQHGIGEFQLSGPITRHVTLFAAGRFYTNNQGTVVQAVIPTGPLVENFIAPERNYYGFGRLDYDRHHRKFAVIYKYKYKSKRDQDVGAFNLPESATNFFNQENEVTVVESGPVSDQMVNEARFRFKTQPQSAGSVTNTPAIIVHGFFTGGGSQVAQRTRETSLTFEDIVSLSKGRHTLRVGGQVRPRYFDIFNGSNFGGTYDFSSLKDFEAGTPTLFTVNRGNPEVSFSQHEFFSFIQDEIRVRHNLSLSLGLRHEFQSDADNHHNFAPRVGLAYAPGGRTVIRAGAGVFYDRLPEVMEQQALLYNGSLIHKAIIQNPSYPVPTGNPINVPPSVTRIAPGIVMPYLIQENLSIEHHFGNGRNMLTLDFTGLRGLHLYRMRNVNAPLPGTTVLPDPSFVNIDQFESSGMSRSNSMTVSYQTTLRRRFDLTVQYVLSKSMDDTPGILPSSLTSLLFYPMTADALFPANPYDLRGEWGRSDFDRRNRVNLVEFYRLPWGFKTGAIVSFSSGVPFSITTGKDENHDNVVNDRPPGVGRNTGRGPGYADVDLHLGKEFRVFQVAETARMEFGVDAFNVLNHVNYKDYVGVLTSPFFGRANAAQSPRRLQMSFRFKF